MDSYVTTDRPFLVTLGYAPLPINALRPGKLDPISSRKKLMEYIEGHKDGLLRSVHCLDEDDARRVCEAFQVPRASVWIRLVVRKKKAPKRDEEIAYMDGIKG